MSFWIESLNQLSEIWFGIVSNVVLQSLVVFAFAWIAVRLLRKFSAALRFYVWQAAALKLLVVPFSIVVALPVWPSAEPRAVPEIRYEPAEAPAPLAIQESFVPERDEVPLRIAPLPAVPEPKTQTQSVQPTALACVFLAWASLVVLQIANCLRRRRKLTNFLAKCHAPSDEHRLRVEELADQLGVSTPVSLVRGGVQVPLVTGVLRPKIIFPLDQVLERDDFDQIVMHELAHVKRCDLVWVWLPEVLRMLFFFHPIVYWIQRQASLSSEMACDEIVLSAGSNRKDYARTLLELASPRSERKPNVLLTNL